MMLALRVWPAMSAMRYTSSRSDACETLPVNGDDGMATPGISSSAPGLDMTLKLAALVPTPRGVVTAIVPLVAPEGTVTVIRVALGTLKLVAGVPWKATLLAPLKPLPVKVTEVPTGPEVGVKPVTVGAGTTDVFTYAFRHTLASVIPVVRSVQLEPVGLT